MKEWWFRLTYRRLGEWRVYPNQGLTAQMGWAYAVAEAGKAVIEQDFPGLLNYRGHAKAPGYETTLREDKGRLYVALWRRRWRRS